MKCELAAALIHRPMVLFLDEPTIGLDVSMQTTIRAFIRDYNERYGATLILTSHYMDDVAALTPAGDRDRQGPALLRRQARRPRPSRAAGEARRTAVRRRGPEGGAASPGQRRPVRSRRSRAAGAPGYGEPDHRPGAQHPAGARSHGGEPAARGGHERAVRAQPRRPGGRKRGRGREPAQHGEGVPDLDAGGVRRGGGLPGGDARVGARHHHAADHDGAVDRGGPRGADRAVRSGGVRRVLPRHLHRAAAHRRVGRLADELRGEAGDAVDAAACVRSRRSWRTPSSTSRRSRCV